MTFDAHRDTHAAPTAAPEDLSLPEFSVRDGRIVSPENAARIDERRALEAKLDTCRAEMKKQHMLIVDGSSVGERLKTLADMFQHSLSAIDGEGDGIDFGYLVADIIEVMAARLDALERQARESLNHCEARVA